MKNINIFCTSQAATAIRLSIDEPSSSSTATMQLQSSSPFEGGVVGRAIDRYNPIITDSTRILKSLPPPTPKPHSTHQTKNRKSTSNPKNETKKTKGTSRRIDQKRKSISSTDVVNKSNIGNSFISRKSWSCTNPGAFITPPGSTRYLLGDEASLEKLLDTDQPLKLNPDSEADNFVTPKTDDPDIASKKQPEQVVVLRVSLHCKACEKKMRKHISRMQGVSSFNIDFATNKVTVVGEVNPLDVLASISKVKSANLWTPLPPQLLPPSSPSIPTLKSTSITLL